MDAIKIHIQEVEARTMSVCGQDSVTQFQGLLEARDWKCWKEAIGSAWLEKNKPHAEV